MNGRERVEEFYCAIQAAASGVVTWESMKTKGDALIRDLDRDIRWRPIADAPKDGTHILLRLEDGEAVTAKWRKTGSGMPWINPKRGTCWTEDAATHFAFLTPPEEP